MEGCLGWLRAVGGHASEAKVSNRWSGSHVGTLTSFSKKDAAEGRLSSCLRGRSMFTLVGTAMVLPSFPSTRYVRTKVRAIYANSASTELGNEPPVAYSSLLKWPPATSSRARLLAVSG